MKLKNVVATTLAMLILVACASKTEEVKTALMRLPSKSRIVM